MSSVWAVTAASVPHVLFVFLLLVSLLATILIRGDAFRRGSVATTIIAVLPWAIGDALLLNLADPDTARPMARFMAGSFSLFGPACMIFLLTMSGRLDRYRYPVLALSLLGLVACVVTWSTDLVTDGVHAISHGWYPSAGTLMWIPLVLTVLSVGLGVYLSLPAPDQKHSARRQRYMLIMGALVMGGGMAPLLVGYGVLSYPLLPFPGAICIWLLLRAVFRHDLLHSRGFDRAAAYELAMVALLVPMVALIAWACTDGQLQGGATLALVMLVPIFGGTQAGVLMMRNHIAAKRTWVSTEADQAVERLAVKSLDYRSPLELKDGVVEVLDQHSRLSSIQLWLLFQEKHLRLTASSKKKQVEIDLDLQDWLSENRLPLHGSELPILRLHGMREPLEQLFEDLECGVILPLADRDRLVGIITAASPPHERMLTDGELQLLREVGRAAAKSLTFISLFVEAEERIEIDKELEVAAAVQYGRTLDEVRHDFTHCQVIGHYTPAAQFGGDWWSANELSDERVLVVIGDVTGRGVPAALVSSTALAACQTAQALQGASCEVLSLLELLNTAVRTVGGEQYEMTSFAILIDWDSRRVTYANGGHRFPYLVRPNKDGTGDAILRPLISRGTHLGVTDPVIQASTIDIEEGDYLVLFSDAAVEARNAAGKAYGDKRLQQVLKRYVPAAGNRACKVILDDILAHCGDKAPEDDLTLVVVRLGVEIDR